MKLIQKKIIDQLWERYKLNNPTINQIETQLLKYNISSFFLDHFAIIDLPGPFSGIEVLKQLFLSLDFVERGKDYLPEKQNDFLWMAAESCLQMPANEALPQIVIADFRLEEMPNEVREIISNYSHQTKPLALSTILQLTQELKIQYNEAKCTELITIFMRYLSGRDWPLPTVKEFNTVRAFNELLAWVLVFGRKPNHFTLATHLLPKFETFEEFLNFIQHDVGLKLNHEGGIIKGNSSVGILQASTLENICRVKLSDGEVELPVNFVEFVWRYPIKDSTQPAVWEDYFTGFIAQHANHVIESLYA